MTVTFHNLISALKIAFKEPVSENDYHNLVQAMRDYGTKRESKEVETQVLTELGYPVDYDPCEHMEKIRSCMVFVKSDNPKVVELLKTVASTSP